MTCGVTSFLLAALRGEAIALLVAATLTSVLLLRDMCRMSLIALRQLHNFISGIDKTKGTNPNFKEHLTSSNHLV